MQVKCYSAKNINPVVDVIKIVHFIPAEALNHRQLVALLEEHEMNMVT